MEENIFVFIFLGCYIVCVLCGQVGSTLSNTTVSNHTNETVEENTQETITEPVAINLDITNFTNHLSKKYQSIFDALKEKAVETKTKEDIDFLARSYDNKFKELVNKTQKENLKTISGRRNAFLYTLDSANVILNNLVNHLQDNLKETSNEDEISPDLVQDEAAKFIDREKEFICDKFHVCRESESFSDFMHEILAITSKLNYKKLNIMINTLKGFAKETVTEILRDPITKKNYAAAMDRVDHPFWLNKVFTFMKNIIEHKRKPLAALGPEPDGRIVAKTYALIEALDAMDKVSPPTKENKELWKDLETSVKAWAKEKRKELEIKDMMQKLMNHIFTRAKSYYVGDKGVAELENTVNIFLQ